MKKLSDSDAVQFDLRLEMNQNWTEWLQFSLNLFVPKYLNENFEGGKNPYFWSSPA